MRYFILILILLSACSSPATQEVTMTLTLSSNAFAPGQSIPSKYACTGRDISPDLVWMDAPAATQSYALIVDDPDAPMGTWVHWVIFNIPATATGLPEDAGASLPTGSVLGKNSSGKATYMGPCPPSGTHRYFFKLYALDTTLTLSAGASKADLLKAMDGHILAQGELMGTFSK